MIFALKIYNRENPPLAQRHYSPYNSNYTKWITNRINKKKTVVIDDVRAYTGQDGHLILKLSPEYSDLAFSEITKLTVEYEE